MNSTFTYQGMKLGALFLIVFVAVLFPPSVDPSHKSIINALAPFEIVADGFREPMGVVVDDEGVVYLSDRKAGKVFEIKAGEVETLVRHLEDPVGFAFDSERRLLIVEEDEGRLLRLEDDGSLTVLAERMKDPRWVTTPQRPTTRSMCGLINCP